jgi:DNA-binding Lrp family transcriptional regulator
MAYVPTNEFGLTDRDMELLEMMMDFGGKTYMPVLEQTAFLGVKPQTIRNRLQKLQKKHKVIRYKATGLVNPRNALLLSENGKRLVYQVWGINVGEPNVSPVTTWHTIYEQITYYWLKKLGRNPERTIVTRWSKKGFKHTPDLVYFKNEKPIYVEIELTPKRQNRLIEMFQRMKADGVAAVLYVFENDKKMKTLGTKIPVWDKISYITIQQLIENAQRGKIGAIKQTDYLKEVAQ